MEIEVSAESMTLDLPRVSQTLDYTCGAACFASMAQYFQIKGSEELRFAKELGTLDLGYTPPSQIARLATEYGLRCELKEMVTLRELVDSFARGSVIFVTWWDEDAGHYSLVRSLTQGAITLMDPWTAREGRDNQMPIQDFITNWKLRGSVMIAVSSPRAT